MVKKFNQGVREYRRTSFDEVARLYDEARPGYPKRLYSDLIELSGIPVGGRILEIGAGTGQATKPLAELGYKIVAVELGEELARVAREKLKIFQDVQIHTAAFEDWPIPKEPFDLVIAATAFHWIDPNVRFEKTADALKQGGAIGIFGSWKANENSDFFRASQHIYDRYMPPNKSYEELRVTPTQQELEASGLFIDPQVRDYEWEATYSAEEYINLISTYSDHRRLAQDRREGLFSELAKLINNRFEGKVMKVYATQLVVARKK